MFSRRMNLVFRYAVPLRLLYPFTVRNLSNWAQKRVKIVPPVHRRLAELPCSCELSVEICLWLFSCLEMGFFLVAPYHEKIQRLVRMPLLLQMICLNYLTHVLFLPLVNWPCFVYQSPCTFALDSMMLLLLVLGLEMPCNESENALLAGK
ncbi:membrane protein [Corchorus olitorius]|uniref:Membrane protein n=1 Tax=Corchorus olitorius TaxID=93759 RepID=A0A1R3G758_9ROSI|nr:membrane protein [Corchorus olitorius]